MIDEVPTIQIDPGWSNEQIAQAVFRACYPNRDIQVDELESMVVVASAFMGAVWSLVEPILRAAEMQPVSIDRILRAVQFEGWTQFIFDILGKEFRVVEATLRDGE